MYDKITRKVTKSIIKDAKPTSPLSSDFSSKLQIYGNVQWRNQEFLRAGKVSWNEGTSINISSTAHKRKAPQGNMLEFFSYAKKNILNENFNS